MSGSWTIKLSEERDTSLQEKAQIKRTISKSHWHQRWGWHLWRARRWARTSPHHDCWPNSTVRKLSPRIIKAIETVSTISIIKACNCRQSRQLEFWKSIWNHANCRKTTAQPIGTRGDQLWQECTPSTGFTTRWQKKQIQRSEPSKWTPSWASLESECSAAEASQKKSKISKSVKNYCC